ncbi:MAG TPA: phosphopantetheine-binding protein, partial [Pyrinomonadaceae bacterium]
EYIAPQSFDVVVLNSVVQYFPGMDYLVRVLEGACRALRPGGHLFIGDVRSLPLLRMLHAGIELERSGQKMMVAQLRERLEQRMRQEQELVIEPEFFRALAGQPWGITGVNIQLKRGWRQNELTRFRYDVVLQVNGEARPLKSDAELSWDMLGSVEALKAYLRKESPELLLARGVPNARLSAEELTLEKIEKAEPEATLGSLGLEQLSAPGGVEPEQLWALERELPYEIQLSWDERGGAAASFNLLCIARPEAAEANETTIWKVARSLADAKPWSAYANTLRRQPTQQHLAQTLRQVLSQKLPDYMLPSTFVWLDALPLTPTGKLNRRALPAPDSSRPQLDDVYAVPETELERQVATVWSQVLGIEKLGIDSSFFNIGGHSLLAMQVVSRLSDSLNLDIPLRLMFEKPTIRGFAETITRLQTGTSERNIPRIVPVRQPDASAIELEQLTDEQVDALISGLLAKGGAS